MNFMNTSLDPRRQLSSFRMSVLQTASLLAYR